MQEQNHERDPQHAVRSADARVAYKSSRSQTSNCVEVAQLRTATAEVALRDSKDPNGPVLLFPRAGLARLPRGHEERTVRTGLIRGPVRGRRQVAGGPTSYGPPDPSPPHGDPADQASDDRTRPGSIAAFHLPGHRAGVT